MIAMEMADENRVDVFWIDSGSGHIAQEIAGCRRAVISETGIDQHEIATGIDNHDVELVDDVVGRQKCVAKRLLYVGQRLVDRQVGQRRIARDTLVQRGHLELTDLVAIEARPLLAGHGRGGARRSVHRTCDGKGRGARQ